MYDMEDLLINYSSYNEITIQETMSMYEDGRISKKDLLEAYLLNEGFFGYTDTLWSIYEALK